MIGLYDVYLRKRKVLMSSLNKATGLTITKKKDAQSHLFIEQMMIYSSLIHLFFINVHHDKITISKSETWCQWNRNAIIFWCSSRVWCECLWMHNDNQLSAVADVKNICEQFKMRWKRNLFFNHSHQFTAKKSSIELCSLSRVNIEK